MVRVKHEILSLNLEERHCKQGTITQLKVNDKDLIQSDRESYMSARLSIKISTVQRQVNDYRDVLFPPTREVLSVERKQHCEGLASVKSVWKH